MNILSKPSIEEIATQRKKLKMEEPQLCGICLEQNNQKMVTQSTGSNARLVTCGYTLHASQTITIYWGTKCVSIVLFNKSKLVSIQIITSHMLP